MSISQYTHETEINFENLEKECKNLERQLFPLLQNKEEEETEEMEEIWYNLCSKFGLILVESPAHALRHGIIERLWAIVYPRISDQRNKHSKTSRNKKLSEAEREESKQTLKTFLQEYIEFYDKISKVYLSLFDPEAFKDDIQHTDHNLSQECLDDADKPAIVPILYKLLARLGDLYRYQGELDKALHNYDMAAFLSPGQGNHHNQRAVLEIDKQNNCKALYYYARSIKVSHKPFETSYENMERLYKSNKAWLRKNNQAGLPTRSDKRFKIRLFNALFVDLHRRLKVDTDPAYNHATTLDMDGVIREFESVLKGDVYSDKVLCMMVVINAFSASDNGTLSQILTFRFGTALVNFVERNLSKKLEILSQRNTTIRGLLPLLLVCDYILTLSLGEVKALQAAEEAFWTKVCTLINTIKGTEHSLELDESSLKNKLPKDYKDYEGFTPFENFISKPSKYTNFEDARDIVLMAKNSKSEMKEENTKYRTRLKLAYLLAMTEKTEFLVMGTDGYYIFLRDLGSVCPEASVICISDGEEEIISKKPLQNELLVHDTKPVDKVERKNSNEEGRCISLPNASTNNEINPVDVQHQKFVRHTAPQIEIIEKEDIDKPLASSPRLAVSTDLKPPPVLLSKAQHPIPSNQREDAWDILAQKPTKNPFVKHRPWKKIKEMVEPDCANNFLLPDEPTVMLNSSPPKNSITLGEKMKNIKTQNPFFIHRAHIWPNAYG